MNFHSFTVVRLLPDSQESSDQEKEFSVVSLNLFTRPGADLTSPLSTSLTAILPVFIIHSLHFTVVPVCLNTSPGITHTFRLKIPWSEETKFTTFLAVSIYSVMRYCHTHIWTKLILHWISSDCPYTGYRGKELAIAVMRKRRWNFMEKKKISFGEQVEKGKMRSKSSQIKRSKKQD